MKAAAARLTNMTINGLPGASYAYDPAVTFGGKIGNMTSKTEGGVTLNFTYSAQHVHGSTYTTYDRNGNASQSAATSTALTSRTDWRR